MSDRMSADWALVKQMFAFNAAPSRMVVTTALASAATLAAAVVQGWPLWGIVVATLVPWVPVASLELAWTSRIYGWLALFYVLTITQVGHFLEHVVQMVQIHIMSKPMPQARGVFGELDIEWVHFAWNTWVFVAVALLVRYLGRNPWLWATLVIAAWHGLEHVYMIQVYLSTGRAGDPGFLASGGLIGGGLPLTRPDLHFLYNLVETVPLVIAFIYALRRTQSEGQSQARLTRLQPGEGS